MNDEKIVEQSSKEIKSSYSWYRDKKMIGMILLIVTVVFQIFAFLEVPFMTTIHAYTIGMLFGFYNPFFYLFLVYISLVMIFGEKMKLPKWVKLTKFTYWVVAVSIIFIGASTGYYQSLNGWTSIGVEPWGSFGEWFDKFTDGPWWAPAQTDGGLVGVTLYTLFASATSGIGALVVAVGTLFITISLIVSGSFIGLFKQLNDMRKKTLESKEMSDENAISPENIKNDSQQHVKKSEPVKNVEIVKPINVVTEKPVVVPESKPVIKQPLQPKQQTQEVKIQPKADAIDDFPFEDPFA